MGFFSWLFGLGKNEDEEHLKKQERVSSFADLVSLGKLLAECENCGKRYYIPYPSEIATCPHCGFQRVFKIVMRDGQFVCENGKILANPHPQKITKQTSPLYKQGNEKENKKTKNESYLSAIEYHDDNNDVREYIARVMRAALPPFESRYKELEAVASFLSGKTKSLSGEVFSAKIDGKPTCQFAESHKDDLDMMLRACKAELEKMASTGCIVAPFYFERAAILAKKQKRYDLEVKVCELLILAHEIFNDAYRVHGKKPPLNIDASPRYEKVVKRLPKARENLRKAIAAHKDGVIDV